MRHTYGKLDLCLPPAGSCKAPRGIATLPARSQSRACQSLPQHRDLSSVEKERKETMLSSGVVGFQYILTLSKLDNSRNASVISLCNQLVSFDWSGSTTESQENIKSVFATQIEPFFFTHSGHILL